MTDGIAKNVRLVLTVLAVVSVAATAMVLASPDPALAFQEGECENGEPKSGCPQGWDCCCQTSDGGGTGDSCCDSHCDPEFWDEAVCEGDEENRYCGCAWDEDLPACTECYGRCPTPV